MSAVLTQHIVMTPGICGGRPRVDGTRIRVMDIVGHHYRRGQTFEWLVENFPSLTLADIHSALAFYHDNQELIESEFAVEDRIEAEMAAGSSVMRDDSSG